MHRAHSLPSPRLRQHWTFSPWFGLDGTAGENVAKGGQTGDIFWPKLAATFTFAGVGCRTKDEACCCCSSMGSRHQKITFHAPVRGGVWRFVTTQLGGVHGLARLSGFPVYLCLQFRIFYFRTFVVCTLSRYPTEEFCFFYFHGVL